MTWYIARTLPQCEFDSEKALRLRGLEAFVPRETKLRKRRGQRNFKEVDYALIPGYVAVNLGPSPNWWWVFDGRAGLGWHIRSVVGKDGRPAPVPEQNLTRLLELSFGAYVPHTHSASTRKGLAIGDNVRVIAGPWVGWESRIEDIGDSTCHLLVELFARPTRVAIPVEALQAV
jgi:transcription antitermination factor NusG